MLIVLYKEEIKMAKKENRQGVTLTCTKCSNQNYRTIKNKKNTTEKLELNKFCPKCRESIAHKETK